jgi:hypothetical protein
VPDWIGFHRRPGRGAHNVKDSLLHRSKTGAQTKVFRNKVCRDLIRIHVIQGRQAGLSTGDLAQVVGCSTRTISNILSSCKGIRAETAFSVRSVRTRIGGVKAWIGGVRRPTKGSGRADLKVKLGIQVKRMTSWIRYILLTGMKDLSVVLEALDKGEDPP